jgi:hypothetical protein
MINSTAASAASIGSVELFVLFVLWVALLTFVWGLFVFATSVAWNAGQGFVHLRIANKLSKLAMEMKDANLKSKKDWDMENPNEVRDDSKHKRQKR